MTTIPVLAGRIVWHDLITTDIPKARVFYSSLLGWDVQDVPMGDGAYPMIHIKGEPVGGFVDAGDEAAVQWLPYVLCEQLEDNLERITTGGGVLHHGILPIPEVGRFAICSDPFGASLAVLELAEPRPLANDRTPGAFTWEELLSSDPARAAAFYTDAFGWRVTEQDMGSSGTYRFCAAAGATIAGIMQHQHPEGAPSAWLPYLLVAELDPAHERAVELGAQVEVEPRDIPGFGRFGAYQDPVGGAFALYEAIQQD